MAGLREQWRRAAMRTIQRAALDLFEQHGFAAVTIEQVAAAAEVSPSTVYRSFGTKEGLLVVDEFDALSAAEVAELLDVTDPVGSLLEMVRRYESAPAGQEPEARRRVSFAFSVPSVRAAMLASGDRTAARIAPLLATDDRFDETQARVLARALTYGYLTALEVWADEGGARSIAETVEWSLRPLRELWTVSVPRD